MLNQQIGLCLRQLGLGFHHAAARFQSIVETLVKELAGVTPHANGALLNLLQREQSCEVGVACRDGGRQHEARLRLLGLPRLKLGGRRRERSAVLAPEVDLPGRVQRRLAIRVPPGKHGDIRREIVVAVALRATRGARTDLRPEWRTRDFRHRPCTGDARLGNGKIGGIIERLGHQRIELRIAIAAPPVIGRPVALAGCKRLRGREIFRGLLLVLLTKRRKRRTTDKRKRRERRTCDPPASDPPVHAMFSLNV